MFGTNFVAEDFETLGHRFVDFFNSFNENDTSERYSFNHFSDAMRSLYGQKDLVLSYSSTLVLANKSSMVSEDSLYSMQEGLLPFHERPRCRW